MPGRSRRVDVKVSLLQAPMRPVTAWSARAGSNQRLKCSAKIRMRSDGVPAMVSIAAAGAASKGFRILIVAEGQ
jgi:hypothetical protein